ncbi:MAG: hypothetical protein ACKORC_03155 [Acidimicrobiia bacterium]
MGLWQRLYFRPLPHQQASPAAGSTAGRIGLERTRSGYARPPGRTHACNSPLGSAFAARVWCAPRRTHSHRVGTTHGANERITMAERTAVDNLATSRIRVVEDLGPLHEEDAASRPRPRATELVIGLALVLGGALLALMAHRAATDEVVVAGAARALPRGAVVTAAGLRALRGDEDLLALRTRAMRLDRRGAVASR